MLTGFLLFLWFSGPSTFLSDAYYDEMVAVRRHLHQHPELSNREVKTRDYLESKLREVGFTRIERMAKTGLRVVYETGKPGPVLAFRADIDALPVTEATDLPFKSKVDGVMHACGHDIHTGALFGAALAVKNDPDLTGTFVFLFQPAEEGPPPGEEGGAPLMIAEGALDNPRPDVIFGFHTMGNLPLGQVGYRAGGIMARADRFYLKVEGKQAHGAAPHEGIDPIVTAAGIVSLAQTVVSRRSDARDPVVLSFGEFNAGQRFNIIPQTASLSGTIRTLDVETGDKIPQMLDQVIAGVTAAHGAKYHFENETMCPSTQNDTAWTERAVAALKQAGFATQSVAPVMAAEDFAYFTERIPGVYFFLGVCDQDACENIHSPRYQPAEESLKYGARLFHTYARAFGKGS